MSQRERRNARSDGFECGKAIKREVFLCSKTHGAGVVDGVLGPGGNSHVHVYILDSGPDLEKSKSDEFYDVHNAV